MHDFHIPVMGLAYTVDTPIKVAKYGIDSVISIVDDELLERMTLFYSDKFGFPYIGVNKNFKDFRAKRISNYLNLVNKIVKIKFEEFKMRLSENKDELKHFLDLLSDSSHVHEKVNSISGDDHTGRIKKVLDGCLRPGRIDVNIMTKVDKEHYKKGKQLPVEYNDAHSALRGFAMSNLESSVVLSAGMNPKLYSYISEFEDFYYNETNAAKKRIILKVSDFRSALIQGKFLAHKGLWVSEYRIESGLNCGGHAFASDGQLLGLILQEFKDRKEELVESIHPIFCKALKKKSRWVPLDPLKIKITVQGGVGTAKEHQFLIDYYKVDSVGWGSPFLLVPEATSVDKETRELLAKSKEKDLYLSGISPLGVPFNTIKNTSNQKYKQHRIDTNKPGSSCPRKLLTFNKEFHNEGLCTASKKYQNLKIEEITKKNITDEQFEKEFLLITEKSCLCVGLANSVLFENDMKVKGESQGVVVCPGPNIAYFTKEVSLSDMISHIYGRQDIVQNVLRPNMFIKELMVNIDFYRSKIKSMELSDNKKDKFRCNLLKGIAYYKELFRSTNFYTEERKNEVLDVANDFEFIEEELGKLLTDICYKKRE